MIKIVLTSEGGRQVEWSEKLSVEEFAEIGRQYDMAMRAVIEGMKEGSLIPVNK